MTNTDTWTSSKDEGARHGGDRQAESRKARILDAARALFLKTGFDKGGLREIAAAAGLTKSAIYLDFASKDLLLDELIRHDSLRFAEELFAAVEEDTAPASFGSMFSHTINLLSHAPFVKALLVGDTTLLGSYVARNRARFVSGRSALNRALLEAMQRRGRLYEGISLQAAEAMLMMLTIGYVEAPAEVHDDGEDMLQEMGRMLDRWLLNDAGGAAPFATGELTALLHEVMGRLAGEGGNIDA